MDKPVSKWTSACTGGWVNGWANMWRIDGEGDVRVSAYMNRLGVDFL